MIKTIACLTTDPFADAAPVAVTNFVSKCKQERVRLLGEELALLGGVLDVHFIKRYTIILLDLLSDHTWSSHIETDMLLSLLNLLQDLGAVVKCVASFLEEYGSICLDLLGRLASLHVLTDIVVILCREELKSLNELLELTTIPVWESLRLDEVFFDLHFRSELQCFPALDVATVPSLHLNYDQFTKAVRIRIESEVGDLGKFLLLGLV